jgi:hypothetical protein
VQTNDAMFDALRTQNFTGALPDMLLAYWRQLNGNSTTGTVNDNMYGYMLTNGYGFALPDMIYNFLIDKGMTPGAVSDMWGEFWAAGGVLSAPTMAQFHQAGNARLMTDIPAPPWGFPGGTDALISFTMKQTAAERAAGTQYLFWSDSYGGTEQKFTCWVNSGWL